MLGFFFLQWRQIMV